MSRTRNTLDNSFKRAFSACGAGWYHECVTWVRAICINFFSVKVICFCHSLNFQSCRHIGHSWFTCWELSHFTIQWIWKQWEHSPQTNGQSSPGSLQSGQQPSNAIRQIPQLSSLATQRHVATAVQLFTFTFICGWYTDFDRKLEESTNFLNIEI